MAYFRTGRARLRGMGAIAPSQPWYLQSPNLAAAAAATEAAPTNANPALVFMSAFGSTMGWRGGVGVGCPSPGVDISAGVPISGLPATWAAALNAGVKATNPGSGKACLFPNPQQYQSITGSAPPPGYPGSMFPASSPTFVSSAGAAAAPLVATAPAGSSAAALPATVAPDGTVSLLSAPASGSFLSSIPWWAWAAGSVGLLMVMR